jgi:hypothetical protein
MQSQTVSEGLVGDLRAVFEQTLGCNGIDPDQDLFELGLTSVLVAHAVVLARRKSLSIQVRQVYQDRTIGRLVKSVGRSEAGRHASTDGEAEVPLTPTKAFLMEGAPTQEHLNIAAAWRCNVDALDFERLRAAIAWTVAHHDEMRIVVSRNEGGALRQTVAVETGSTPLTEIDLSDRAGDEAAVMAEQIIADMQSSFRFRNGEPLYRFLLIKTSPAGDAVVVAIVHQLITDGFGFRVMLERISDVYRAMSDGRALEPYRAGCGAAIAWSRSTALYAQTDAVHELPLWTSLPWHAIKPILRELRPGDDRGERLNGCLLNEEDAKMLGAVAAGKVLPESERKRVFATQGTVTRVVDRPTSERLFGIRHGDGQSGYGDFDLVALSVARAVREISQSSFVWLDTWVSRRGNAVDGESLTDTIGGISELVPILFELDENVSENEMLTRIAAARARFPNDGIGFRALKLLNTDPGVRSALDGCPFPEVSINYRASMQYFYRSQLLDLNHHSGWLGLTADDTKRRDRLQFRLSWSADEKMIIALRYDTSSFSVDTAIRIADEFYRNLTDLIERM